MNQKHVERTFDPNGKLEGEVCYENGQVNGVTKHWHPNGVLSCEIPMRNGIVEGTARFWNERGELIGDYEIRDGTGIQKSWHTDGSLAAEITLVKGAWTGRQRTYFEGAELIAETFWMNSKQVSKRKYLESCKKDPNLPKYIEGHISKPNRRSNGKVVESTSDFGHSSADEIVQSLVSSPDGKEVLDWLRKGETTSRTLGELPDASSSIKLAEEIYRLGTEKVTAVKTHRYPTGEENAGQLVLTLPSRKETRFKIFEWYAKKSRELGFDAELDRGQKHLLLLLD